MAAGKPERAEGWGCGLILLGPHTGNHHWCGLCARKTRASCPACLARLQTIRGEPRAQHTSHGLSSPSHRQQHVRRD